MTNRAPGLLELQAITAQFQAIEGGGRLVIACHPLAARLLRSGSPDLVPAPATAPGTGQITRRVEIDIRRDMDEGAWRLLDGGEEITAGTVGPVVRAGTEEAE